MNWMVMAGSLVLEGWNCLKTDNAGYVNDSLYFFALLSITTTFLRVALSYQIMR